MHNFAKKSEIIKKYEKEKEMTLKDITRKIELTEATVQKYESGNIKKIDVETLKKISDALGVLPENLTEWNAQELAKYRTEKQGIDEAKLIKMYSQLNSGHKKAVRILAEQLLICQQKYNSDK